MLSPAQRHKLRATGALVAAAAIGAAGGARPIVGPAATAYEVERARLGVDLARLRDIQSIEAKIALKRELLPSYRDWVSGVFDALRAGGAPVQDDVLVQVMIWSIDIGDFDYALVLAEYVLRGRLSLPERFNRTAGTMIAEEIADAALKALGADRDFDIEVLLQTEHLTADEDMHDEVRAKLNKAIGLQIARDAAAIEPGADGPAGSKRAATEFALKKLRRALELNAKAGVKKEIERLEREAAKLAAGATESPSA